MERRNKTVNPLDLEPGTEVQNDISSALVHELGLQNPANPEAARAAWLKAAEKGDGWAQLQVAEFLESGIGGPKDPESAKKWRLLAAKQGFVPPTVFRSQHLKQSQADMPPTSQEISFTMAKLPEWSGKIALVIEDSKSARLVTRAMLESAGLVVREATNGREGLDIIQSESRIDVVITDVHMPEINGLEFASKVRENTKTKSLPIIMVTTESKTNLIMAGQKLQISGWIIKPLNADTLWHTFKKIAVK